MGAQGLVYTVRDRSILLPFYKRLFVEPVLPMIPRKVDPNSITHAGHVINLVGMVLLLAATASGAKNGWPFLVTALCLHAYNWCDNADGAHARRVNRCSALGELLDHGLDMLNVTYIAYTSAMAIGAPPLWWAGIATLVPLACSTTYWEQAETDLFSLGLLNQIESVMMLSVVMGISGVFGTEIFDRFHVGAITLRHVIMVFVIGTTLVGISRNIIRVTGRIGPKALGRIAPIVLFDAVVFLAASAGAMSPVAAVIIATAGNVFFGLRCLAVRTSGERPRVERGLLFGAALIGGLVVWKLAAQPVGPRSDTVASAVASIFFGFLALANAREAHRAVAILDGRKASAAAPAPAPTRRARADADVDA